MFCILDWKLHPCWCIFKIRHTHFIGQISVKKPTVSGKNVIPNSWVAGFGYTFYIIIKNIFMSIFLDWSNGSNMKGLSLGKFTMMSQPIYLGCLVVMSWYVNPFYSNVSCDGNLFSTYFLYLGQYKDAYQRSNYFWEWPNLACKVVKMY